MGRSRISAVAITVSGLLVGVTGCAGQSAETEKHLQSIQDKISILQNERDRLDERVSALEQQQEVLMTNARAGQPLIDERPPLKVVRLAPDAPPTAAERAVGAEEQAPAAEADGDRVLISGSGTDVKATPMPKAVQ
jgi:hypothetical protein